MSLRSPADEEACCMTVLVLDDELAAVGDTELALAGALVTPPAPDDVSRELPPGAVEKEIVGVAVVDSELVACAPVAVDVSRRIDVQKQQSIHLFHSQDGCSYALHLMKWTVV